MKGVNFMNIGLLCLMFGVRCEMLGHTVKEEKLSNRSIHQRPSTYSAAHHTTGVPAPITTNSTHMSWIKNALLKWKPSNWRKDFFHFPTHIYNIFFVLKVHLLVRIWNFISVSQLPFQTLKWNVKQSIKMFKENSWNCDENVFCTLPFCLPSVEQRFLRLTIFNFFPFSLFSSLLAFEKKIMKEEKRKV